MNFDDPILFLKFVSNKQYALEVINGELYANTASYYRNIEKTTDEHGQGDINELKLLLPQYSIKRKSKETDEYVDLITNASGSLTITGDDKVPVVCFMGFTANQMKLVVEDDFHYEFDLPFSDEEYEFITEKFGEYCVVMRAYDLISRLSCFGNHYVFDSVKYATFNSKERINSFFSRDIDRFFYKDEDFSYQREYRLVIFDKMPENHKFFIKPFCSEHGEKDGADIVKSNELKMLRLNIVKETQCG